jgi:predicted negative regulator of RcsB-dependent stress response
VSGFLGKGVALVALLVTLVASSAFAQDEPTAAAPAARAPDSRAVWERHRAAWDPDEDSMTVLSGLAGAAAELGELPQFHAFLDSLVVDGHAGPNALRYWGAVGLQLGGSPDTVAAAFAASLDTDTSALVLTALVEVLVAHEAVEPALGLLEKAPAAGVPFGRVALVRGQVLARSGDPDGAVEAWLFAMDAGGDDAVSAAARIGDLAAAAGSAPTGTIERLDALGASAEGVLAGAIAALRARLHAAEGSWSEALEAAGDPSLPPEARGEALRGIARAAREAGSTEVARDALRTLVASGAPVARAEDRLALAEIEDELGGPSWTEHAAEVDAARASGEPERLSRALERALAAGADPAVVAVPRGDLFLARSRPDSALSAYAAAVGEGPVGTAGLEALSRVRLVQALSRSGTEPAVTAELGELLVRAPADPAASSGRLAELADRLGEADSLDVARSLVRALAAEWLGRAGDAAGASRALERAASEAMSPGEVPALLLAAGRWADAAGDAEGARRLWRSVIEDHSSTPYALDARRRMAEGGL